MLFKKRYHAGFASLAAGIAATAVAGSAVAQQVPNCADLNLPHPIYGSGGNAIEADLALVAAKLSGLQSPITILFSDPNACDGFSQFVSNAITGTFKYWQADGTQKTCNPPLTGQAADFAHMGNPASACATVTVPAGVQDFPAPVQTVNIVVPAGETAVQSVSQEALYYLYGFGASNATVAAFPATGFPWVAASSVDVIQRKATAFTTLFLGAEIGVPATAFKGGTTVSANSDVIAALGTNAATASGTQDSIGYVSGSTADADKGLGAGAKSQTLAYQARGQSCGYWPDSTQKSLDKINVRTGQYALWTPGHFFARTSSGAIVNQDVANLIGWYNGTLTPPDGVDVVGLSVDSGDIPLCAMQVTREGLAGAISSAKAAGGSCSHYFEKRATGSTTGKICNTSNGNADCKGNGTELTCNHYGYCEAY